MPLTERTIESAVEGLKSAPGKFQRLVEYYARLTYPHRFEKLVPGGRDSNDVTVKGWPDIYSLSPGGLMDVVEATHSPEWSRHLKEDLEKAEALGAGRLSGFLFVAWANEPSPLADHKEKNPRYEQLNSYRERLVALRIPPENINFVFKKELVTTLAQPRFAGLLTSLLGLQSHDLPFRAVSGAGLFGTAGRYDVFAPSQEEYANDLVHRAAITGEVERRLKTLGWAWLRGRGAAGKTVLAVHVGLSYESKSLPAYYLDLSKPDVSASEALDVISTRADGGVLFIIDNVHLNQTFARDCFEHWQSVSVGSHLLLIGRDTTVNDFRGAALPLDHLREEALTLEVTEEDIEGVFLRLAHRMLPPSVSIPRPPQDVLQRWHRLFGGDLIAFSAAVAQRLNRLAQNDWAIQAQDAARYVQKAYLWKADDEERLNLLRLAVLAQLELDVPEQALDLAKIEPFLQSGLVHFVGRGRENQYAHYRLVHPGLGDLLLTAAGYSDEGLKQFISAQCGYIARRNPVVGMQVAARFESNSKAQEATSILKGIVEAEGGLETGLLTSGFQYLRINCERLTRLGVMSEAEIAQRLVAVNPETYQPFLRSDLHHLAFFIEYAERRLPGTYATLAAALERPEWAEALGETALREPLNQLAFFLGYTEQRLPAVYAALTAALGRPDGTKALEDGALRTPLHDLATFLEYAKQRLPAVHAALAAALGRPEGIKALGEAALRTPLHDLATFLEYAKQRLPAVYAALAAALGRPEGIKALGEAALRTPLDHLATFLEYAERKLPVVSQALTDKLTDPAAINALAETACVTPLGNLLGFLQTVKFGPAVLLAIDQDRWDKSRLNSRSEQPSYFPAIEGIFRRLGRPELAETPAVSLIKAAEQHHWHTPVVGLRHLSHVMRLAQAAGADEILRFTTRVVTPDWLKGHYSEASSYAIAASLFSLWVYHEEAILAHFCIDALKSRVRYELNNLSRMTPEYLLATIELLGVSALIGVRVGNVRVRWPSVDHVNDAARLTLPPAEMATVGYITLQFWLGLRVMAAWRPDQIHIESQTGDHGLAVWRAAKGYTKKQDALNRWMIDWMEGCAKSGWLLINTR